MNNSIVSAFLEEFKLEVPATHKCLERIPESTYGFKPHEKSMEMGYLTLLVAEMPLWIAYMIEKSEIDLATFPHFQERNAAALLQHFEENVQRAEKAMQHISDDDLLADFSLKSNGHVLYTTSKKESVASTINHWVHHRGQLTVYMRLNDIDVPSIYGPSADDKAGF